MNYKDKFSERLKSNGLENEYIVLPESSAPMILLKHNSCNNIIHVRGESEFFVKNHHCFFCEVFEKTKGQYSVINYEQKHKSQVFNVKCNKCNNIFQTTRNKFERVGIKCKKCNPTKKHYTTDSFKELLKTIYNGEYELLEDYNSRRITLKHNPTQTIYENINTYHFLEGRSPVDNRNLTTEEYKKEIKYYFGDEIKVLSEYKTYKTKMKFYHENCLGSGYFERSAKDMLDSARNRTSSTGCPYCQNLSYGEEIIQKILKLQNVKFIRQYKFLDCKDIRSLPFDFAIFSNDKLSYLIEFQGSQHFGFEGHETFYKTESDYSDRLNKDKIKEKYCVEHDINLLKITYKELSKLIGILNNRFEKDIKFNDYLSAIEILQ